MKNLIFKSFLILTILLSFRFNGYSQTTSQVVTKESKFLIREFESLVHKFDTSDIHMPGSKFFLKGSWGNIYTVRAVFITQSGRIVYKTDKHKFNADSCDFIVTAVSKKEYAFSIYKD